MTVLSGFPGVPAEIPGRRSLPQERPEGLSLALPKAVPVGQAQARCAEVVEGLSHCSPEGCFTRREVLDGHVRRPTDYVLGMMA